MTTVWAISDTHLSFAKPRDQTRYGEKWRDHTARIEAAWRARISPKDIVLLPGDLSWAHTPKRVRPDLAWLATLPGRIVLARGNHDFWWRRLDQVSRTLLHPNMHAVQGSCVQLDGINICGTMGHVAPNDPYFRQEKHRSFQRELNWLTTSLETAQSLRTNGEPTLLMMHYPPFTSDGQPSRFTEVIRRYKPDVCVYGHLHFEEEWTVAVDEPRDGTRYHLVACDYLGMTPRRIWPPE